MRNRQIYLRYIPNYLPTHAEIELRGPKQVMDRMQMNLGNQREPTCIVTSYTSPSLSSLFLLSFSSLLLPPLSFPFARPPILSSFFSFSVTDQQPNSD